MADIVGRVDNALNEARILVLIGQVLFAYSFEATFEPKFPKLSQLVQLSALTGITLILICLGFLMTPAAFHWIVERGDDSEGFHKVTSRLVTVVLPVFAAALALQFYVMASATLSPGGAAAFGAGVLAWALFFWTGLQVLARRRRGRA